MTTDQRATFKMSKKWIFDNLPKICIPGKYADDFHILESWVCVWEKCVTTYNYERDKLVWTNKHILLLCCLFLIPEVQRLAY